MFLLGDFYIFIIERKKKMKLNELKEKKVAIEMPMGKNEVVFKRLDYRTDRDTGDVNGVFVHIEKYRPLLVQKIRDLSPSWKKPEDVDGYLHTSSFARYQASVGAALSVFDDLIEKI